MWSLILTMRFRMARRFTRRLGMLRSVVVAVFLAGFLSQLFLVDSGTGGHLAVAIGSAALLLALHIQRGDRSMLASLELEAAHLMRLEYALLALPVLLFLGWRAQWLSLSALVAAVILLPLMNPSFSLRRPVLRRLLQPIPFPFFEWRSGLRRTWPILLPLLALATAGTFLHPMFGWAGLFLMAAISLSHYRDCEPLAYIHQLGDSASSFLLHKTVGALLAYGTLTLPIVLILLARYPADAPYALIFWGANVFLVAVTVLGKYAFYEEGRNLELVLSVYFAIFCLMLIIPYLPAAALLTFGWIAHRAYRRMRTVAYA